MRLGVICPAEIAVRRFMPALMEVDGVKFAGVGVASRQERIVGEDGSCDDFEIKKSNQHEKASMLVNNYGGEIFDSYEALVTSEGIDAVYIPLPPALHYKWAKKALEHGKHVLLEKPFTTTLNDTISLINLVESKNLAINENYMFVFHSQLDYINKVISSGEIGDVRLFRISFGFPMRAVGDFRYVKELGGGSLLDAGGYTLKYASVLLGDSARLVQAKLNGVADFDVDMYGSGVMENDSGNIVQFAFGMDNDYKCELEVWGSKGTLYTNRVLTAPAEYKPVVVISRNGVKKEIVLESDDTFRKSIYKFMACIDDIKVRNDSLREILKQAQHVENFKKLSLNECYR